MLSAIAKEDRGDGGVDDSLKSVQRSRAAFADREAGQGRRGQGEKDIPKALLASLTFALPVHRPAAVSGSAQGVNAGPQREGVGRKLRGEGPRDTGKALG